MILSNQRFIQTVARDVRNARRDLHVRRNAEPLIEIHRALYDEFRSGRARLEQFLISELFEASVEYGRELRRAMTHQGDVSARVLMSEAEAVKISDFSAILLPVLSGEVMREYSALEMLQDQLVTTIQTNFEYERIPGMGGVGDQARVVQEGDPYPLVGVAPDWIDTPPTQKRGMIIPITKECVFFERTSLVVRRAQQLAKWMMVNKEKRVMSLVAGTLNNYKYRDTTYNTYQNGGGGELYDNTAGSNPFVDWRSIYTAELLMSNLRDPMTGEPISIGPARTILCSPENALHISRVVGATEVRHDTNPSAGTTGVVTISRNPVRQYTVLSSRYFADQVGNTTSWILGNFKESFGYMQNWGITTDQAGGGSALAFHNDIVLQFKVSERGAGTVLEPRGVVISNA